MARPIPNEGIWQARRDLNPHHPDLESGALSVRATGLYPVSGKEKVESATFYGHFVSLWTVCL